MYSKRLPIAILALLVNKNKPSWVRCSDVRARVTLPRVIYHSRLLDTRECFYISDNTNP